MKFRTRTNTAAAASPHADGGATNRRKLLFSLLPVFVPAALCLSALAQRALTAAAGEKPFGRMSGTEAQRMADAFCSQITGTGATAVETSQAVAFSRRNRVTVREWDVICDASDSEYLLRINANTRQVFGVNRLSAGEQPGMPAAPCSAARAEVNAKRYLSLIGVPVRDLQRVGSHRDAAREDGTASWNFTYRLPIPGLGKRLLSVSVEAATGTLVCAWTPAFAL